MNDKSEKKDTRGGTRQGSGRPSTGGSTMMRVPLELVEVVGKMSSVYREQQRIISKLQGKS